MDPRRTAGAARAHNSSSRGSSGSPAETLNSFSRSTSKGRGARRFHRAAARNARARERVGGFEPPTGEGLTASVEGARHEAVGVAIRETGDESETQIFQSGVQVGGHSEEVAPAAHGGIGHGADGVGAAHFLAREPNRAMRHRRGQRSTVTSTTLRNGAPDGPGRNSHSIVCPPSGTPKTRLQRSEIASASSPGRNSRRSRSSRRSCHRSGKEG